MGKRKKQRKNKKAPAPVVAFPVDPEPVITLPDAMEVVYIGDEESYLIAKKDLLGIPGVAPSPVQRPCNIWEADHVCELCAKPPLGLWDAQRRVPLLMEHDKHRSLGYIPLDDPAILECRHREDLEFIDKVRAQYDKILAGHAKEQYNVQAPIRVNPGVGSFHERLKRAIANDSRDVSPNPRTAPISEARPPHQNHRAEHHKSHPLWPLIYQRDGRDYWTCRRCETDFVHTSNVYYECAHDCGWIICTHCFEGVVQSSNPKTAPKPAPVLETHDEPTSDAGEDRSCVVCLERDRTHALVPCGHKLYCQICAETIKECATCRQPITHLLRIFE